MTDTRDANPVRPRHPFRYASLSVGALLVIAIAATWPMISVTLRSVRAIGIKPTADIYEVLLEVSRYVRILNLKIERAQADPFGPRIRQLESRRRSGRITRSEERELANVYFRLGRLEDAAAIFNQILTGGGGDYTTYLQVGLVYMRMGELDNCAHSPLARTCVLPVEQIHTQKRGTGIAAEMFLRALEQRDTLEARWLLNLMHMLLGTHPEGVPPRYRMTLPGDSGGGPLPHFTDTAAGSGVDQLDAGRGAALGDFDGDGRTDIVAAGMWGPLSFYRNEGNGRFSDWSERSGLGGIWNTFIVVAADYDNDGWLDLYVTRLFIFGAFRNILLHNEGGGRFRDVTESAGVACPGATMSAAWGDFDLDGLVDLYVSNSSDEAPLPFGLGPSGYLGRTRNALYRNNGDGTFTDVAKSAGVDLLGVYMGAVWGDYNNDGLPDLYVSRFFGPNVLFKNRGNGTFTDVAHEAGVAEPFTSFGGWFWDYDLDGELDLLATAWAPLDDTIKALLDGTRNRTLSMQLYRNRGDGTFDNKTVAAGLDRPHGTMGANFGDLDNDGFPDFALGTGSPQIKDVQPNAVYHNNGDGSFTEVGRRLGMAHLQKGHGYAFGDLNGDGRVDIYLPVGGGYPADSWANILYRNDGPCGNWLEVRLTGGKRGRETKGSNRAALGTRLYLTANGRTRVSEVSGGSGFGDSSLDRHFGLGESTRVDRLMVVWPASKSRQVFVDIPANQVIQIDEFSSEYKILPSPTGTPAPSTGSTVAPH